MIHPRSLFIGKLVYFFYYGAWAFLVPFLALYYKSLGFNGARIGLLASITPLVTLIAAPTWGGIADSFHRHKLVLLLGLIGASLSVLGLSQSRSFWSIALLVGTYAFFASTIIPLIDNSILALLGEHRDQYGAQRVWGAIGWGLAGPAAGALIGRYGLGLSFAGYIALAMVTFISVLGLPVRLTRQFNPFWTGIRKILSDNRWFLFLGTVFISGSGLGVITNFLFLYLDQMHASSTVMGLALTMATLSEIPVLFFSGTMLRKWGARGLLMFGLAAYVLRALLYSLAAAPWQVLLIQLMHGLTFSTVWVAGVSYANEIAPEGLGATAQGLFSSTLMGFGGIVGALVGGLLFQWFGGKGMFFWMGSVVFASLLLILVMSRRAVARQVKT